MVSSTAQAAAAMAAAKAVSLQSSQQSILGASSHNSSPSQSTSHLPPQYHHNTNIQSQRFSVESSQHLIDTHALPYPDSRRSSVYSFQSHSTPSLLNSVDSLPQHPYQLYQASHTAPTSASTQHVFRKTLRADSSTNSTKSKFQNLKSGATKKKQLQANVINTEDKKRYSGIFASNKGVYTDSQDRISRIIVAEIWSRSKLDSETQRRIWELVTAPRHETTVSSKLCDNDNGYDMDTSFQNSLEDSVVVKDDVDVDNNIDDGLTCDEFVVGIWLIDQCLQGRKLPKSVPNSVWGSMGIEVRQILPKKKVFGVI